MSKIIARILENVSWLDEFSAILTVFFIILFGLIVFGVIRMKKENAEEYKKMPLNESDHENVL